MNDILVVGPTGNVGSELIRQLHGAGHGVRALVRDRQKAKRIASLATPVIGDLAKPKTLTSAFAGAQRVFILAPPIPEMETLERNAFDAAVAAGAKRIVYLSNYGAAENDRDHHFHVHGKHERRLASLNLEWTVLRPTRFMTYTPFVWSSVLKRGLLIEGGGAGKMTVIDPADIAAVALKALTEDGHEGRTYELTSEDAFTAADLAQMLARVLKRDITIFEGDVDALRTALVDGGAPAEYAPLMAGYFARVAAGHFKKTDAAGKLLGHPPRGYADWLEQNLPTAR
jgi:uncharacterized protein YbjT (DUF2867 family)